ncbi:hypothetical protein [Janthinobacterium sp. PSPC3-1]|uniref:hypothetical protein n=1 Tax=Janthinobacterium sp. PSPC3-1 TaxID=2804653 RepID=UPI003CF6AADB
MINFTIRATWADVRKYVVTDQVCKGVVVFDDFLANGETATVSSCDDGGGSGLVTCQRSDGPLVEKDVSEGATVDLD